MKALLKYPGSKWSLAPWICRFIPKHKIYLEPFCGSLAVFFNKKPVEIETINDIDSRIQNFFEVCRDYPEELARAIYLTPYSRKEYETVREDHAGLTMKLTGNKIEDARRFAVRCNQSFGGRASNLPGWRNIKSVIGTSYARRWNSLPETIMEAVARLKNAQIESRPAIELLSKYNNKDCFTYIDAPYLFETRSGRLYSHEMGKAEEHEELLTVLLKFSGSVIISGYESDLYNKMLKGWHKEKHQALQIQGKIKQEILWMNFCPAEQLDIESVLGCGKL